MAWIYSKNLRFFAGVLALSTLLMVLLPSDVHRIPRQNTGDFEHFYYAADAVLHGKDPYAAWTRGYIYPPLIAFLYQPLALLGRTRASGLMLGVNVVVTIATAYLAVDEFARRFKVQRSYDLAVWAVFFALLLNVDKVKSEWQMWQTDVWMLLLFVLALRWLDRRPALAGAVLGIAVNIKYLPLLFVPYLAARRRWGVLAGLLISTAVFAIVPAVSSGWQGNIANWRTALAGLADMTGTTPVANTPAAEIHDVGDSLSCSITSACARLSVRWHHPKLAWPAVMVLAATAFTLISWRYRRAGVSVWTAFNTVPFGEAVTAAEWVAMLCAVLAFSPQTNTRHLYDALLFTAAAVVLLSRMVSLGLLLGTTVMVLGLLLPPGARVHGHENQATIFWLRVGGPCFCLLLAGMTLLNAVLKASQSTSWKQSEVE